MMRSRARIAAGSLLVALLGCTPAGRVNIGSLNLTRIRSSEKLIETIVPEDCYFWIGDQGECCIAMTMKHDSWRGEMYRHEFELSLVLEGTPAGSTRMYPMSRRSIRGTHRKGAMLLRFASTGGVAAVWNFKERTLSGRFRCIGLQQSFFVLTGWSTSRPIFCEGEFTAVYDREKGEAIRDRTEEGSMKRLSGMVPPTVKVKPPRDAVAMDPPENQESRD